MGNSCRKPKNVDSGPSDPPEHNDGRTPEPPQRKLKPVQVDVISNKNYLELPRQSFGGGGHLESNQSNCNGTTVVQVSENLEEKDAPIAKDENDQNVNNEAVDTPSQNGKADDLLPVAASNATNEVAMSGQPEVQVGHELISELEARPEIIKILEADPVAKVENDAQAVQKSEDIEQGQCKKLDDSKIPELGTSSPLIEPNDQQTPTPLTELAVHEMAQKCLLSHGNDDKAPVVSNEEKEIEKDELKLATNVPVESCVSRAKFAEILATDILSSAQHNLTQITSSDSSESEPPLTPKNVPNEPESDRTNTLVKIHEICQTTFDHDHPSEISPIILVTELETTETKADLASLVQKAKDSMESLGSKPSPNGLDQWPPEMVNKLLEIHAEAQAVLLEKILPCGEEGSETTRNGHARLQGKNSGPKISVSFADGKAFLKAPPTTSLLDRRVEEEVEQALDAEARRKISIMNRRPTGPFLPQLDKVKFRGGMGMSLADEDDQEDEEEEANDNNDEDDDEDDEGISFDIPRKLSELIAVFEEPKKSS